MGPLTVLVKPVSSRCDLACQYCFYQESATHRSQGDRGYMTEVTSVSLIDWAFAAHPSEISFVFQGGEPLLCGVEFYQRFCAAVAKRNTNAIPIHYTLQTNGCCMDEAFAACFAEHEFLIGISMDGPAEIHDRLRLDREGKGSYAAAIAALQLLQRYQVPCNILTVLTSDVCARPAEVWEAVSPYGYWQYIPYIPRKETDPYIPSPTALSKFLTESFALYAQAAEAEHPVHVRDFDGYVGMLMGLPPVSCAAGGQCGGYLAVESDGSVYPCDFYMTDDHLLGNIRTDSVCALLTSPAMTAFLTRSYRHSSACEVCRYIRLCRGGCPRLRYRGDYLYCEAYQAFFAQIAPTLISLVQHIRTRRTRL